MSIFSLHTCLVSMRFLVWYKSFAVCSKPVQYLRHSASSSLCLSCYITKNITRSYSCIPLSPPHCLLFLLHEYFGDFGDFGTIPDEKSRAASFWKVGKMALYPNKYVRGSPFPLEEYHRQLVENKKDIYFSSHKKACEAWREIFGDSCCQNHRQH